MSANVDPKTVEGFGQEWSTYQQRAADAERQREQWEAYFRIFPFAELGPDATGFDLGCGSGRWALLTAPKVGRLHCIDASAAALQVARRNLSELPNVEFHHATVDAIPLEDGSMDFGYSLGVVHHIPDTAAAIRSCVQKLKPGAPFLLYIYYAFDNRPAWFRLLWKLSDAGRRSIARLPFPLRLALTRQIAAFIYMPLARTARALEKRGRQVDSFPLSYYRHADYYTMRTDALDRFGTHLEQRFTLEQIKQMMADAGLERMRHSDQAPYWCVVGYRAS